MDVRILILLLYGCEVALSFHRAIFEYHIIHLEKTWFEARQYCRQHYTDLATFRDMDDLHSFKRPSSFTEVAWIGLFDDPASWKQVMSNDSNSWRWSVTGTTSPGGYQNWKSREPENGSGRQYCAVIRNGLWGDENCVAQRPFVCFTGSSEGQKQYSYISIKMSWEDARSHCRQHYTDLAMIEDEAENTAVASVLVPDQWAWISLYRQPWRWSDGSDSQFTNWGSGHPDNYQGNQHCVWEHDQQWWNDAPCSYKRKFVCHRALMTEMHHFTIKLQTDADLSDPTYSMQMTKELVTILQNKGLTDLNVKWKTPPQKMNTNRKSLNVGCLN